MDEGSAEKISDAIFNLIPEVTRLKELFQNWDKLDEEEKQYIDAQIEKWNSPTRVQLYKTVKRALNRWGKVQDTEGAPGCEPGWFTFSCDTQLEEELINVLQATENLLRKAKQIFPKGEAGLSPKNIPPPITTITATFQSSKSNLYHLSSMTEELAAVTNLPEVPPSSPDSESENFLFSGSPEKHRSEPLRTCGRSLSLHSGRRFYHHCHSVKSAPLIKDGYNTD